MKICENCGMSDFEFVVEDHYVKYQDKSISKKSKIITVIIFWLIFGSIFIALDSSAANTLLIIYSIFAVGLIIYIIFSKPPIRYKEKRKTIAVCKDCWHKHLLEDPEEQNAVELERISKQLKNRKKR